MAGLRLSFLGAPQIELDGEQVKIGASKAFALLAYLVVSQQAHGRDALSTLLWPESDQSRARAYLRHALWTLKTALGEQWLVISREQIGFRAGGDFWLDIFAFQAQLAAVSDHEHPGGRFCDTCLERLQEAVSLYRDDFLAGFSLPDSPAFDEWQFFHSEALRHALAGALQRLVEEQSARGAHDLAIASARRWLSLDPLHEPTHRSLMRLYALSGQRAAALRQYAACVRLLAEELGVEPDPETTALYEAIRTRQFSGPEALEEGEAAAGAVAARYLLQQIIDRGAHGDVYRGQDLQTNETVTIKKLRPEAVSADETLVARFVQEAEALSRLNHPNIVRLLDAVEWEGDRYLVMEYVPAGSLARRLQHQPQLSLHEVLDIALELADALTRAHHLGIIHRDVKPDNVLLAEDGTPRLTDFGVARLLKGEGRLTETGALVGSPVYMSPEILQGADPDVRSDIWSFGVLLFEMLAGEHPFSGDQMVAVLTSVLNDPLPDIHQIRPEVSPALSALLQRMLVKEPALRVGSMRQVAAELEAIREGREPQPLQATLSTSLSTKPAESDAETPIMPIPELLPFVAREQELARLHSILETAVSGETRMAFVLGEAGQGKTSLLQAFALQAQEAYPELVVVGGNCNAYTGRGDPYLPFREILDLLTADPEGSALIAPLQPQLARRVNRLLPTTARSLVEDSPDLIDTLITRTGLLERTQRPPLSGQPWRERLLRQPRLKGLGPDPNLQQSALLEQYARLLHAVARHAPLLLLLDDLQWVDPGSASLLFHLGRRLTGSRIAILGAYRPDEVAMGLDEEAHPLARVINELQRIHGDILIDLEQAEGQAFVDAWLDREPNRLAGPFRQTLYRQTGGHPLFTIELLRAMRDRGDLRQDQDGVWQAQPDINWHAIPMRVEGVLEERVRRLDPLLQEMLQVASVEGEEFTAEVVAEVLNLDQRAVVRRLSGELDRVHGLVRAIGSRRAGQRRLSRYRFRHILIQRYLYYLLDEVERIYQHEAVGRALEMLYEARTAHVAVQLARHFRIAELPDQAAAYLRLAGDQASRAAALTEAVGHYQAALPLWPAGDEAGRAQMLRKLGECQWMIGRADDALQTLESGYRLFQTLGDMEEAGAMQRLIGRVYWEAGRRSESLQHYQQALSILESLPDSVELAWAISSISQMHMNANEYQEAIAWGERALQLARRLGANPVVVHALNNTGNSYLNSGQVAEGRKRLEESIRLALDENLPHDAGRGRLNLAEALAARDFYDDARILFEALYEQASQVHTTLYAGSALIELARLDWLNGRWQASLARRPLIDQWLAEGQSMAYLHVIASTVLGRQHNDLGQPEAAYEVLARTLATSRSFDEIQLIAPHAAQLLRAASALGLDAEAEEAARKLLRLITRAHYISRFSTPGLIHICEALPAEIFSRLTEDIVDVIRNLLQDESNKEVPSRHAALHEAQGLVAWHQGDEGQALGHFRQAAQKWVSIDRPYDQARALQKLGCALAAAGRAEESREVYDKGFARISELSSQLSGTETKQSFLQSPLVQALQQDDRC